jgi:hypothetical protein
MALPRENRTAKVIAVEAAIKKMSPQELAALPGLDGEDFKVFGTLIQHFCFIDLNLRRALELFAISKKECRQSISGLARLEALGGTHRNRERDGREGGGHPDSANMSRRHLEDARLPESRGALRGQAFP